jgi:hypothetical protein
LREDAAIGVLHLANGIIDRFRNDLSQGPLFGPIHGIAQTFD